MARAGDVIFDEGELGEEFYVLLTGAVGIYRSEEERRWDFTVVQPEGPTQLGREAA